MYDICCIGHITLDKVVTATTEKYMAGGTSFYFSNAIRRMPVNYYLLTAVGDPEKHFADDLLTKGIPLRVLPTRHTLHFENIYQANQDHRIQHVPQQADPFSISDLLKVDAKIYHLGPLLAGDIPEASIPLLAAKGNVSLDVQGYLRKVNDQNVYAVDWTLKKEILPYVSILKANETEMERLTGETDIKKGAKLLADMGVSEVVITLGSKGSVIFNNGVFYTIPAYLPLAVIDATGCGDTYMAGYLAKRVKEAPIQEAGEFGAAMATLKIQSSGPFTGTADDVLAVLEKK